MTTYKQRREIEQAAATSTVEIPRADLEQVQNALALGSCDDHAANCCHDWCARCRESEAALGTALALLDRALGQHQEGT